ncbi:helix-turn-helix domain-containing protein [Brevibacterium oceani]|uniref:helix-turn-helix domain-containing protein n=1 Tax=Brevibacterium oceani TaxID=358099 RepID=UPI0015E70729|nr:helix-turn-helix domain-containing protein [Brevibacterium oceani]
MVEEFDSSRVMCHLDALLTQRDLSLTELSKRVGVSLANLSVLKNNRAKAVRYSTLIALCEVLDCQPGDLFTVERRPR